MKFLLVTSLLLGGVVGSAAAQMKDWHAERPGADGPQSTQLDALTRDMSAQLHLNEAQYIKLRTANRVKLAQIDQIQWRYRNDVEQQQARKAELEAQYQRECSRILTPSQLSLYHDQAGPQDSALPQADANENGVG